MPVSPARVLERLRPQLAQGFFERVDAARARAAGRGDVPDHEIGWIYGETFQGVLEDHGGSLWRRALRDVQRGDVGSPHVHAAFALPALSHWRHTRGIYDFDPDLREMLTETVLNEVPAEALARLPEYAPYLLLNGYRFQSKSLHGAWVLLFQGRDGQHSLQLALHHSQDQVLSLSFGIVPGLMVSEMVVGAFKHMGELAARGGMTVNYEDAAESIRLTEHVLCMALYLCSQEPDIQGAVKSPPALNRGKVDRAYVPPQADNMLSVGFRHGGVIRMWKQSLNSRYAESSGLGMPKAPHLRRAHFALYWTGKGRTVPRVRWIAPIAVNVKNVDDMAAHVRPVEADPADAR